MNSLDQKLGTNFARKINLNNTHVRQFRPYPGLYPVLAKIIVDNAPYARVEDVFELPGLTDEQKLVLRDNVENFFVDKFQGGEQLYR